jgi:hypothetical protein
MCVSHHNHEIESEQRKFDSSIGGKMLCGSDMLQYKPLIGQS